MEDRDPAILDPRSSIFDLDQTWLTQPALFVVEYALAQLWMSWGLRPDALIGHSIGEYVAACLAGVFTLEDALALVAARGRLMQDLPGGTMLSVSLAEPELQPLLEDQLSIAAINSSALCVVSGPTTAVERLEQRLAERGLSGQRLHTSHAFHSMMMDPILEPFAKLLGQMRLHPPQIPYLSNVTGTWVTAEQATNPHYWATHLRATVRFAEGLGTLLEESGRVLLEVGPGRTLCTLARQHPNRRPDLVALPSLRHPRDQQPDLAFLLNTLGRLWLEGVAIDWGSFYAGQDRRRIPLPTYPFERQRYWVERPALGMLPAAGEVPGGQDIADDAPAGEQAAHHQRPGLPNPYIAPRNEVEATIADIWQELLGIAQVGVHDNFYELGGHSLLVTQVAARLRATFPVETSLQQIFEAQTVASQALALIEALANQDADEDIAELLAEIEQLTPDDVQALLDDEATFAQTGGAYA
jgi:acyl transferase domain-containing protein